MCVKNLVLIITINHALSKEIYNYFPTMKSVYNNHEILTMNRDVSKDIVSTKEVIDEENNNNSEYIDNSKSNDNVEGNDKLITPKEEDNFKNLIEEKFKFKNDNKSRRYKVSDISVSVSKNESKDQEMFWAFRSMAARRIVGGIETSISMYPYNVAISKFNQHWCGGSIIDEQWVLTAGHCMESAFDGGANANYLAPFILRAGSSIHNRGGYQAKVNKAFFHPKYVPGNADYDYCLLRLDRPLPIGKNIAVLNLPSADFKAKEGDFLIVTGWGSTDVQGRGSIPERLRFVPVPTMSTKQCQKRYSFYITDRMLCAGYETGEKDACNHDSGGPAVKDGILLGVVSFGGKQCGDPSSPGVYSKVSKATDWVENTIKNNEAHSVPELRAKIKKSRERISELQKFKSKVYQTKTKIQSWLKETLKSSSFLELAKQKLEDGADYVMEGLRKRRNYRRTESKASMAEMDIDHINLSNQIRETIIEAEGEHNEQDKLLGTLAMQQVIFSKDFKWASIDDNEKKNYTIDNTGSANGIVNQTGPEDSMDVKIGPANGTDDKNESENSAGDKKGAAGGAVDKKEATDSAAHIKLSADGAVNIKGAANSAVVIKGAADAAVGKKEPAGNVVGKKGPVDGAIDKKRQDNE